MAVTASVKISRYRRRSRSSLVLLKMLSRLRPGVIAALLCALWLPVRGAGLVPAALTTRPAFAAADLTATLPAALQAPVVPPSLQLVSMVAHDVDADGDLDVVASDGSLDLIVWINDGTGQLTRHAADKARPRPHLLDGLRLSPRSNGPSIVVVSSPATPLLNALRAADRPTASARRAATSTTLPITLFSSTRSPRGPPSFTL